MNKIVTIDSLDHQGRGITHIDGKVMFVFNALEGEAVEAKILKVKKNIIEAKSIRILKESKDRIKSDCPYFGVCGGCDLLHMTYQKQLGYKENKVKEIMKKFAGITDKVLPIVPNEHSFYYRNKVIFKVDGGIGFYFKKSNQVVKIEKCLLLNQKMNELLFWIKENMDLKEVKEVMIRVSEYLESSMIVFDVTKDFKISQIPVPKLKRTSILVKRDHLYEKVCGDDFIVEKVGEYQFKISPEAFFQVNTEQMKKLYKLVLDYSDLTGKENVLDLYCGTGTIGIFLSEKAKKVIGVEINKKAIEDANWNKEINHISNIDFVCGDVGSILKEKNFNADLVVVDPPRAGLDEKTVLELSKIKASKMIYVSCDPVTLARDIRRLSKIYEVINIIPVDMFSNTYHVECVCLLNRR